MTTTATTKVILLGGGRHCQVSSQIGPLKTASHSHAWQIGINSRRLGRPGKRVTVSLRNSLAQHVLPAAQRVSAVLGVAPACAGSRYRSGRGCVGIYVVEGPAVPPRQPRESRVAQELPLGNELLTREFIIPRESSGGRDWRLRARGQRPAGTPQAGGAGLWTLQSEYS